eukprot:TRINITY_DN891_c0_g1_i1.p1 TRINITY_DN891_c0_g1~~TRINITY_DN891_c0_g1_i1.p1  ORF type:complete len:166 (-),score=34.25 TRINITY_DN891_c0_g1_i1:261-758(-)
MAEEVPNAKEILVTHVAYKGFQAGALVGAGVSLLAQILRFRSFSLQRLSRASFITGVTSSVLSTAGVFYMMQTMPEEGVTDRAFRLQHNQGQLAVDKMCFQTGAMAALANPLYELIMRRIGILGVPTSALRGISLGVAVGVVAHVASSNFNPPPKLESAEASKKE